MRTHSESILGGHKDPEDMHVRMELQGQCRIRDSYLLEISYLKTGILFVPVILSIIGLLIIKYYKTARAKLFYWEAEMVTATHIFIKGPSRQEDEIVPIVFENYKGIFYYKKLKYELTNGRTIPIALNYERELANQLDATMLREGLDRDQVETRREEYGRNEHSVDPPQYWQYLYEVMTEPFFFLQYLAAVIYIIERLEQLAFLLLGASIATTSINYILLYLSYTKLKDIAEKVVEVDVLREGEMSTVTSDELVPGDIIVPSKQLSCDLVMLRGEVYVDESNLTGQSVPIGKQALTAMNQWDRRDNSKWIYEGSKVLSAHNDPLAMVIHVGYSTKRGRILRKILNRSVKSSHLFTSCIYFLTFTYIIAACAYLFSMDWRLQNNKFSKQIIVLNFLLIVTMSYPPACPIYFNLVYSCCLMRLKWNDILGTEPEKTVEAAHLSIMCFDKTGTLTKDEVEVAKILHLGEEKHEDITKMENHSTSLDYKVMASCHTVRMIEDKMMGDEIDLKLFRHSGYQLLDPLQSKQEVSFEVETGKGTSYNRITVLSVYQYESKFQSMSALIYDHASQKHYVVAKGAPEKIHRHSRRQFEYFDSLLQDVSYGGFRCIAYGCKQVSGKEIDHWRSASREEHLEGIDLLGFAVFNNDIKPDAKETIEMLGQAAIDSRVITGDNVYIAIETAIRCGILSREQEVLVIEGQEQTQLKADDSHIQFLPSSSMPNSQDLINAKALSFEGHQVKIKRETMIYLQLRRSQRPVIIDNDFLKMTENSPEPVVNARVYCRISPQNKALVVRQLRKHTSQRHRNKSKFKRIFISERPKIGMTGDGANDLLAIKEADIGIGIKSCDSSYAASFSVERLSDVSLIVSEAKCGEREIMEVVRFSHIAAYLTAGILLIMETEAVFFSPFQLIFGNITKYIVFNLLLALSKPVSEPTPYKPCANFMSTQHQLVFWGNVLIATAGHAGIYVYHRTRQDYVQNFNFATIDSGWTFESSLVSSQYFLYSVHAIVLVFCLHGSSPFKEPFYKNIILLILVLLNVVFVFLLFFLYDEMRGFFELVEISGDSLFGIGMICLGVTVATVLWNAWIDWLALHEKHNSLCRPVDEEEQEGEMSIGSESEE